MLKSRFFRRSPDLAICAPGIALALGAALFLLTACGEKSERVAISTHHYKARGLIRGLPPDHKTIDVEHEDIQGFMPSMTMPFEVRDEKEARGLQIGDAISFRLNVTQRDSWIDRIQKIEASRLHLPRPSPPPVSETNAKPRLREGDQMPAFQLIDQDGKQLTLETFRGHPFIVTFIFTRCPLPNFCPRMSQNFAELQKAIQAKPNEVAAARLLSISFDPKFDTAAVLKQYAQHEGADPAIWKFATGKPEEIEQLTKALSIFVQPEGGTISHSLATALIDRTGKVAKIWRGNSWTPGDVMTKLARMPGESRP
ncbi:MAG: SCO family protein [Verrucomicrobiota bacterium]|nr:SCO family protein [Verrucomicrobiota bacterium]